MKTDTYHDIINSSPVVLVEFFASWCPHCQKMMPAVARAKELLAGKAGVYTFDIDENQALAEAKRVKSIPTFLIYNNGETVWRHTGEIDGEALLSKVESYL